ncbi:MAG: PilZ domain-containing protein [Bacteriovorax sp.]|nr:PilZ domain-containing protein [Bacteriovorax sp.]
MERHLSLIKTDYQELEKRVFPRFPFGFMIFREEGAKDAQGKMFFEVKDISLSGMQLTFKDGAHTFTQGSIIEGNLQWRGESVQVKGKVQWIRGGSIGLSFLSSISFESKMRDFLSYDNIVSHIKALHDQEMNLDLPNNLKYWLKADGVLEIFVWEHTTSGISRFQILLMEHFIEWEEGIGLRTGRIMTQRDLDTPLSPEDEFVFQIDESANEEKAEMALGVVRKIREAHLPSLAREFLVHKLGG